MMVIPDNTGLRGRGFEEPGVREGCFRAEWELAGIIQPHVGRNFVKHGDGVAVLLSMAKAVYKGYRRAR